MTSKTLVNNKELIKNEVAYTIYSQCMYNPTEEKYRKRMEQILQDKNGFIYFCFQDNIMCGMISLRILENQSEILGIAVSKDYQKRGVGSFMIRQIIKDKSILKLYAETDDDAVEFYKKCGFDIHAKTKNYGNMNKIRYISGKIVYEGDYQIAVKNQKSDLEITTSEIKQ